MRRGYLVQLAHDALRNPDRRESLSLLEKVNLSQKEREVIVRSELDKTGMETLCNTFGSWNRKTICSYSHAIRIKRDGMTKIGLYLEAAKARMENNV